MARKLESARRLFIAALSYLARRGASKRLADLAEHDLIGGGPAAPGERSWAARRNGRTEIVAVELASARARRRALLACASLGLGVAIASIWMCAEELASGALAEVLMDYSLDPMVAFAVFLPDGGLRERRESRRLSRASTDTIPDFLSRAPRGHLLDRNAPIHVGADVMETEAEEVDRSALRRPSGSTRSGTRGCSRKRCPC